jgi:hypothetical protein
LNLLDPPDSGQPCRHVEGFIGLIEFLI